jgi:hypothetical protein
VFNEKIIGKDGVLGSGSDAKQAKSLPEKAIIYTSLGEIHV